MEKLISSMKITLGTAFALYLKAHSFHWNVEGPFFNEYHQFFGEIYKDIWTSIDDIAEQIRQLDAYTPSSLERFIELSRIKSVNDTFPANEMLLMLLNDTEILIKVLTETFHLAESENKQGLANFLAERIEAHNKWRWQLRATAKRH